MGRLSMVMIEKCAYQRIETRNAASPPSLPIDEDASESVDKFEQRSEKSLLLYAYSIGKKSGGR